MCRAGVPTHVLSPCQLCKLGMGVVGTQEDPGPAETVVHGKQAGLAGRVPLRREPFSCHEPSGSEWLIEAEEEAVDV